MHAAVVHSFDAPPRYGTIDTPQPRGPHEVLVDIVAAGLHPRVRSAADGTHYTCDGTLPMVPGIDGVGRTPEGELLYFVAPDGVPGTMAEYAVVDRRRAVPLPADSDPYAVAAAMNPGMSSWVALRRRVPLPPGASVLVLGATGNAGRLAVRIAKHLGAAHVVAAGRDPERLAVLGDTGGADVTVRLTGGEDDDAGLADAAADVDVVVDYLWGRPTEQALRAVLTARADRARPLAWIQIGSVAGPDITLPSAYLRAANVQLVGSGQGSVGVSDILAELPELAEQFTAGTLSADPLQVPLAEVEKAWTAPVPPEQRIVLTPGG